MNLYTKDLGKNTPTWTEHHTNLVKEIKQKVEHLPCISIPHPNALLTVESNASNLGYGGILKQEYNNQVHIVRYHSGIWLGAQINYSTVKKEVLSIVLCISKFQNDLINKKFLLKIDCKTAKDILQKDVKNLVSKQIFPRWQVLLSNFVFEIEYIKGELNSLTDFLTWEFLQGKDPPPS